MPEVGKAPLFSDDPLMLAVASTGPVPGLDRPLLALDDVAAIADFMLAELRS